MGEGNTMKHVWIIVLLFCLPLSAQTLFFGHSFTFFAPFTQSGYFTNFTVSGWPALTCAEMAPQLQRVVGNGQYKTVVLTEGTNDIETGVSPQAFAACMLAQVLWLQQQGIAVFVTNVSPWNPNPLGCNRYPKWPIPQIGAYNAVFPTLGATVIDEWTPAILTMPAQAYGWGKPYLFIGACGIHPDQPQKWPSSAWQAWLEPLANALYQ